jgi:hypothetical protein
MKTFYFYYILAMLFTLAMLQPGANAQTVTGTAFYAPTRDAKPVPDVGAKLYAVPSTNEMRIGADMQASFSETAITIYSARDADKTKPRFTMKVTATAVADQDGHFTLKLLPGTYTLFVLSAGSTHPCNRDREGNVGTLLLHLTDADVDHVTFNF